MQSDAALTQADGCPQRPVHQAVQSPKVTRRSEGGPGLKKERQGLGNKGFWKKVRERLQKKNSVEKAKTSPSAPLKMSQVSPRVTHPLGEEEAGLAVSPPANNPGGCQGDSDRRLLSISPNTHPSPPPMSG